MIDLSWEGKIAILTLNRPEKRNAFNNEMVMILTNFLNELKENKLCRALLIKAKGDAFCAGADLEYLQTLQKNTYQENLEDSNQLMAFFKLLDEFPKFTLSQIEGAAFAGGCGIASVTDFCFATPNSQFAYTEVKIGFIPAIVSVFLSAKIGENKAKELLLTGKIIDAETAKKYSLITDIFEKDDINDFSINFLNNLIQTTSPQSIELTKSLLKEMKGLSLNEKLSLASEYNAKARSTDDCKHGIKSFLNKEKINWN